MSVDKSKVQQRWLPFCARNFQTLMLPSNLFCLILGLFPYKMESSNYVSSTIRYIYSSVITAIYFGYTLVILYQMNYSGILEYDSVPGMLQGNAYLILGLSISILTYISTSRRLRVLQNLVEVSTRLPPETYNKIAKWMHAKDIVGFLFLVSLLPNVVAQNLAISLSKVIGLYITMIVFVMDMFYMNCVWIIKACFERINNNLMNLKMVLTSDEPHLLRRVYHEQRNPLLLVELRALKKLHLQISDVVTILNDTFSYQLVCTVTLTFIEVTFSLYFYILQRHGSKEINLEKQVWYSYFITSVAYYSTKLIIMIWICEGAKDQVMEIGSNIHGVLISTTDKQIKDELELFSLQALHRDNVFFARGLTMDATLLTKMVGGITTYLLILIQFLLSVKLCE